MQLRAKQILFLCGILFLTNRCGVKGPPVPYVETHPEVTQSPVVAEPSPIVETIPSPTPSPVKKQTGSKKRKQE